MRAHLSYLSSLTPVPPVPILTPIPSAVTILGQRFSVSTWREVNQITLESISVLDNERFENIITQFPRFVGHDRAKFRSSRQLPNGAFMETNLSAEAIHRFCLQAAEVSGLSSEDWHVEYAQARSDR